MKRENMYIGQPVTLPAKEHIVWENCNEFTIIKEVIHQPDRTMFVRELHNPNCAGLSYSMDTPAEKSCSVLYEVIMPHRHGRKLLTEKLSNKIEKI